jgi:hypothetical protein
VVAEALGLWSFGTTAIRYKSLELQVFQTKSFDTNNLHPLPLSTCLPVVSLHLEPVRFIVTNDIPEQHEKNPERVAAGLKASINNPHVSQEAKAHAAERLHELGEGDKGKANSAGAESNRVLGMLLWPL